MSLNQAVAKIEQIANAVLYNKESVKKQLLVAGFVKRRSAYEFIDDKGKLVAAFTLVDSKKSTSNTVTSLKNVLKYSEVPFVAVFLDADGIRFKLINSSLIKKASHSSQKITTDRIVGSINTGDIMSAWGDIANVGDSLVDLFALHVVEDHEEQRQRIVEATQAIKGRAPAAIPDWVVVQQNLKEGRALLDEATLMKIRAQLFDRAETVEQQILDCAERTTPKAFGDCVERTILCAEPAHALGDIDFANGRVAVDIKARTVGVPSSPKAFNVQKLVDHLSAGPGAALFFMVTVDVKAGTVTGTLIQMLHPELMKHYWHDVRWSGRGSLGTLSLKGDLTAVLNARERLDLKPGEAVAQLKALLSKDDQAS